MPPPRRAVYATLRHLITITFRATTRYVYYAMLMPPMPLFDMPRHLRLMFFFAYFAPYYLRYADAAYAQRRYTTRMFDAVYAAITRDIGCHATPMRRARQLHYCRYADMPPCVTPRYYSHAIAAMMSRCRFTIFAAVLMIRHTTLIAAATLLSAPAVTLTRPPLITRCLRYAPAGKCAKIAAEQRAAAAARGVMYNRR